MVKRCLPQNAVSTGHVGRNIRRHGENKSRSADEISKDVAELIRSGAPGRARRRENDYVLQGWIANPLIHIEQAHQLPKEASVWNSHGHNWPTHMDSGLEGVRLQWWRACLYSNNSFDHLLFNTGL